MHNKLNVIRMRQTYIDLFQPEVWRMCGARERPSVCWCT